MQLYSNFTDGMVFIERSPLLQPCATALYRCGQPCDHDIRELFSSRNVNNASSKNPLSALTQAIFMLAGTRAKAPVRNATTPRAERQLPLRNHPCNTNRASAKTATSG